MIGTLILAGVAAALARLILPGPTVVDRETPPPRSSPTDTGAGFIVGLADRGPVGVAISVRSLREFVSSLGDRQTYSVLYDWAETFFREGGSHLYVSRYVGPAAATATHSFLDSADDPTLVVRASSPGGWGNNLKVAILTLDDDATIPAGSFVIQVLENNVQVEKSPPLVDQAAALLWEQSSDYVDITAGTSANDPVKIAATSLAGGADDRASATDTQRVTALDAFPRDLGAGQVAVPGATSAAVQLALLDHAWSTGRVAVLDGTDTASVSTLLTQTGTLRGTNGDRYSGLFAPWDVIPGIFPGTTRTVPPSARVMGNMARNDSLGISQNQPAAGERGQALYVIDLSQDSWSDTDREALNDGGVNVSLTKFGGVRTYGYRTLVDPVNDAKYLSLGNARLHAAVTAVLDQVAESFVFSQLDGKRITANRFGGEIIGALMPFYTAGSLYGDTPGEAFAVDVGPQVNTDQSLARNELHATVALRMSPFGERVIIEVTKVPITEALA